MEGKRGESEIMQTLKKVKKLYAETETTGFITLNELMKRKFIDYPIDLAIDDWNLSSADVVFVGSCKELDEKILPLTIWFDYVYPKMKLFVLGFCHFEGYKVFEIYLTPRNIKYLIEILQKGLEYLGEDEKEK
jgi:hypothetical protein